MDRSSFMHTRARHRNILLWIVAGARLQVCTTDALERGGTVPVGCYSTLDILLLLASVRSTRNPSNRLALDTDNPSLAALPASFSSCKTR
jgi:hypothetical protein